ncbi:unnamed protein product [Penicillium salamii]|nr:unnamed protein product [Penicillium salamii]
MHAPIASLVTQPHDLPLYRSPNLMTFHSNVPYIHHACSSIASLATHTPHCLPCRLHLLVFAFAVVALAVVLAVVLVVAVSSSLSRLRCLVFVVFFVVFACYSTLYSLLCLVLSCCLCLFVFARSSSSVSYSSWSPPSSPSTPSSSTSSTSLLARLRLCPLRLGLHHHRLRLRLQRLQRLQRLRLQRLCLLVCVCVLFVFVLSSLFLPSLLTRFCFLVFVFAHLSLLGLCSVPALSHFLFSFLCLLVPAHLSLPPTPSPPHPLHSLNFPRDEKRFSPTRVSAVRASQGGCSSKSRFDIGGHSDRRPEAVCSSGDHSLFDLRPSTFLRPPPSTKHFLLPTRWGTVSPTRVSAVRASQGGCSSKRRFDIGAHSDRRPETVRSSGDNSIFQLSTLLQLSTLDARRSTIHFPPPNTHAKGNGLQHQGSPP